MDERSDSLSRLLVLRGKSVVFPRSSPPDGGGVLPCTRVAPGRTNGHVFRGGGRRLFLLEKVHDARVECAASFKGHKVSDSRG